MTLLKKELREMVRHVFSSQLDKGVIKELLENKSYLVEGNERIII